MSRVLTSDIPEWWEQEGLHELTRAAEIMDAAHLSPSMAVNGRRSYQRAIELLRAQLTEALAREKALHKRLVTPFFEDLAPDSLRWWSCRLCDWLQKNRLVGRSPENSSAPSRQGRRRPPRREPAGRARTYRRLRDGWHGPQWNCLRIETARRTAPAVSRRTRASAGS